MRDTVQGRPGNDSTGSTKRTTIINENLNRNHSLTSQELDDQIHLAIHFCHHSLAIEEIELKRNFYKISFFPAFIFDLLYI